MSVDVKICGLRDEAAIEAAACGGARFLGFVFAPASRRYIGPTCAASLIGKCASRAETVGLFVDPSDADLEGVLKTVPLKIVQLHGLETPERVLEVKKLTGLPVIKAVGIGTQADIALAQTYENAADYLLLDAKTSNGVPAGGQGAAFDWGLLAHTSFSKPWLLAGGLSEDNLENAVRATQARILDVSSGVEDKQGQKSPEKIKAFLEKARSLETCC